MKKLYALLFCCISLSASGINTTYQKLIEVNKCWKEQQDVSAASLPALGVLSERDWISTHLSLVESILRKRTTDGLTPSQKHNRARCLDHLHSYWQAGNFPINEDYTYRTPIFIDKHDNFCAVGYLVKATGNENISRMIAAQTNLAYVREMNYPELTTWAADNGFTVDELAWIQPGYPSYFYCGKVGNGVNGSINELFVEGDAMYVGGSFSQADGTISANNIAYVTEAGGEYTWHNMGSGVNGPVYAIAKFAGNLFVAGSFSTAGGVPAQNIAYWDGSAWHSAGCVSGTVHDLLEFDGELYAAGDFDDCITSAEANFAKLVSGDWVSIPGIVGRINTMEEISYPIDSGIVLGGAFTYDTLAKNVVIFWKAAGFVPNGNSINNEVMDFEFDGSEIRAACKQTSTSDSNILLRLNYDNEWDSVNWIIECSYFKPLNGERSLNTIFQHMTSIDFGGQFTTTSISQGCFFGYGSFTGSPSVDSAINRITIFKSAKVFAGKFKNGNDNPAGTNIELNGIGRLKMKVLDWDSVEDITSEKPIRIFPNPTSPTGTLTIESNFNAGHYTLHHITGKQQATGTLSQTQQLALQNLHPGMYIITLSNDAGDRVMQKIVVE